MSRIKLSNLLTVPALTENYGGPGKMVLPSDHKAGIRVPKGGSCCANCLYWQDDEEICTSKHYIQWAGTNTIPYPADEYCTNWWEPIPDTPGADTTSDEESDMDENMNQALGLKQIRVVIEGDSVASNHAKIIKLLTDLDPEHSLKYYPATEKIVGSFAKVKAIDKKGLSLAQKRLNDNKLKATIIAKPSGIK
jgi:hypothetical protein